MCTGLVVCLFTRSAEMLDALIRHGPSAGFHVQDHPGNQHCVDIDPRFVDAIQINFQDLNLMQIKF